MQNTTNPNPAARYVWIGFAMAIACMIALFIYGLIVQNQGMVVMASSIAALSGGVWSSTHASMKKKERESA